MDQLADMHSEPNSVGRKLRRQAAAVGGRGRLRDNDGGGLPAVPPPHNFQFPWRDDFPGVEDSDSDSDMDIDERCPEESLFWTCKSVPLLDL